MGFMQAREAMAKAAIVLSPRSRRVPDDFADLVLEQADQLSSEFQTAGQSNSHAGEEEAGLHARPRFATAAGLAEVKLANAVKSAMAAVASASAVASAARREQMVARTMLPSAIKAAQVQAAEKEKVAVAAAREEVAATLVAKEKQLRKRSEKQKAAEAKVAAEQHKLDSQEAEREEKVAAANKALADAQEAQEIALKLAHAEHAAVIEAKNREVAELDQRMHQLSSDLSRLEEHAAAVIDELKEYGEAMRLEAEEKIIQSQHTALDTHTQEVTPACPGAADDQVPSATTNEAKDLGEASGSGKEEARAISVEEVPKPSTSATPEQTSMPYASLHGSFPSSPLRSASTNKRTPAHRHPPRLSVAKGSCQSHFAACGPACTSTPSGQPSQSLDPQEHGNAPQACSVHHVSAFQEHQESKKLLLQANHALEEQLRMATVSEVLSGLITAVVEDAANDALNMRQTLEHEVARLTLINEQAHVAACEKFDSVARSAARAEAMAARNQTQAEESAKLAADAVAEQQRLQEKASTTAQRVPRALATALEEARKEALALKLANRLARSELDEAAARKLSLARATEAETTQLRADLVVATRTSRHLAQAASHAVAEQSAIEAKWWARVQTLEEKLESAGKAVRVAHLEQEAAEATTQRLREVLLFAKRIDPTGRRSQAVPNAREHASDTVHKVTAQEDQVARDRLVGLKRSRWRAVHHLAIPPLRILRLPLTPTRTHVDPNIPVASASPGTSPPFDGTHLLDEIPKSMEAIQRADGLSEEWFYLDPSGCEQGPFEECEVLGWIEAGYLPLVLAMRSSSGANMVLSENKHTQLSELCDTNNGYTPFVQAHQAYVSRNAEQVKQRRIEAEHALKEEHADYLREQLRLAKREAAASAWERVALKKPLIASGQLQNLNVGGFGVECQPDIDAEKDEPAEPPTEWSEFGSSSLRPKIHPRTYQ